MASHGYRLRTSRNRNYRDLSDVHLPRVTRSVHKQIDKLYPVEVVQWARSRLVSTTGMNFKATLTNHTDYSCHIKPVELI